MKTDQKQSKGSGEPEAPQKHTPSIESIMDSIAAVNNASDPLDVLRELAVFSFSDTANKQGSEFAYLQLCKIKRKARAALAAASAKEVQSETIDDVIRESIEDGYDGGAA